MSISDNGTSWTYSCTFNVTFTPGDAFEGDTEVNYGDLNVTLPSHTKAIWSCYQLTGQDAVDANCSGSSCWRSWGTLTLTNADPGFDVANGTTVGCNGHYALKA